MPIRRILLICGGLEPGHDGVGDYCRRLAEECARCSVDCAVIALNDRLVREVKTEPESFGRSLRLPSALPRAQRYAQAARFLSEWRPDWISLQFVAYGFDDRGLPFADANALVSLLRGYRVHVMLHELWLGLLPQAGVKERLVGALQRALVLRLVRRLRPGVVHTSHGYAQAALARAGIYNGVLPLFGNIPIVPEGPAWADTTLFRSADIARHIDRHATWMFGIFGSVPGHWPIDHLFARLEALATKSGKRALVLSIGRTGDGAQTLFERWRAQFPQLEFRALGPRSTAEISQFLQTVDFGLSPYPECLLGKSGAATAMFEHGLPVIVTWGQSSTAGPAVESEFEALLWRDDDMLDLRLMHPPARQLFPERGAAIARAFLHSLEALRGPDAGASHSAEHARIAPLASTDASMKILISCYSFYPSVGGLEEVNALLARAFVARGHAVKVATMTRSTEPDTDTFEIMRVPSTTDLVRALRWCDVFLQANVSFRLGWPNFFIRHPWVISLHGNLDAEEGRDGIFSWKSRLKRLSLFTADRVIAVSRAVAIRTFPQALVIGNPYRTDVFRDRPDAARPYDLVFLGRLVSDKGVHLLIDALALLGEQDIRPSLLIIGGGPEESALRERCRTYNLTTQVTFAGVRHGKDLVEHLNKCRVMVIPSVWEEPFGIVALEGIACGCVVVAANVGGLPDAVGPCGLIFAKGDATDLANVLSGLLANEERIRALQLGAADYLFAHRPEAVADNYLRALAGVS